MIFLDFETRSRRDLRKVGGRVYAADDSTEILCGVALDVRDVPAVFSAWSPFPGPLRDWHLRPEWLAEMRIGEGEVTYADPLLETDDLPPAILAAAEEGVEFCAHNAHGFDAHIWRGLGLPPVTWCDTVDLFRRAALPGDLQRGGEALFGGGKDKAGQRVMRLSWAPRAKRGADPLQADGRLAGEFLDPDASRLNAIVRYCAKDVALMAQAFFSERLDGPHPDDAVLRAHERINERGALVDLDLARLLLRVDERSARAEADAAVVPIETLRSPLALVAWLRTQGVRVDNVQAPTLRALLEASQ